jgi:hypothetical protein
MHKHRVPVDIPDEVIAGHNGPNGAPDRYLRDLAMCASRVAV